ncbi:transaldolase family protein [Spirosoma migulaei]
MTWKTNPINQSRPIDHIPASSAISMVKIKISSQIKTQVKYRYVAGKRKAFTFWKYYSIQCKQFSLAQTEQSNRAIFYGVAVADIQRAADLFAPVYEDKISGADGFVSLEVSPYFALDAEKTIQQARFLWQAVDRPNVMIKIPGIQTCLPAIRQAISEGININVTLLFGLDRYRAVAEAYIAGLEDRLQAGQPIDQLASVASFLISRIDTLVDPLQKEQVFTELTG